MNYARNLQIFWNYNLPILERSISKVNEWIDAHEDEILTLWEKAQKGEPLNKIEPLK